MKFLVPLISLLLYLPVNSQENKKDSTTKITANWEKGENKILLITHNQTKFKSGKISSVFSLSYEAHISVISFGKRADTIQWIFHLPEKYKKANPGIEKVMPVYEGMRMLFTINESGSFKELLNWEEVRDVYIAMFEESLPDNLTDSIKTALTKSYLLFNSREMAEVAFIKEIQAYHSPFGGNFSTTEKITHTTFPNPFGGGALPAVIKYQLSEIDPQADSFNLTFKSEMDSLNIGSMMDDILTKMNLPPDSSINEMKKQLTGLKINDSNSYIIMKMTGWIKKLSCVRTAIIADTKEIDAYTMRIQ
ncbi:MAG: hypothetical protein ABIR30_08790 [Chitinophagaceae bacterium]